MHQPETLAGAVRGALGPFQMVCRCRAHVGAGLRQKVLWGTGVLLSCWYEVDMLRQWCHGGIYTMPRLPCLYTCDMGAGYVLPAGWTNGGHAPPTACIAASSMSHPCPNSHPCPYPLVIPFPCLQAGPCGGRPPADGEGAGGAASVAAGAAARGHHLPARDRARGGL
jgi:hypothetical protein